MKKKVYIETTIISYLTSRLSRDRVVAGHQEATRQWWEKRREDFDLYVSGLVIEEAREGDPDAAQKRIAIISKIPLLDTPDNVFDIARALIAKGSLPEKALGDAAHLAIATVRGMDFLLTWNCKHLANAEMISAITETLETLGFDPPVICTPDSLLGEEDDV